MSDMTETSPFGTMGEGGIPDSFINMSGERSPYTKPGPGMGGPGKSGAPDDAKADKGRWQITDAHGPRLAPITRIVYQTDPSASATGRNVRVMKSATGVSDFWDRRGDGQA